MAEAPEAQTVFHGEKPVRPDDLEAEGMTFGGWYTDYDFEEEYDFDKPVTNNVTVYAKWISPHVHVYDDIVVDPTCTEDGYTVHSCDCGDTYTDSVVPALGHDWSEWTAYEDPDSEIRTCARCGQTEVRYTTMQIIKTGGYGAKIVGLDPANTYLIRYATGEYANANAVKKGENAGFVQVSGVR